MGTLEEPGPAESGKDLHCRHAKDPHRRVLRIAGLPLTFKITMIWSCTAQKYLRWLPLRST
eukprot:11069-Amphidinium_carterae.1